MDYKKQSVLIHRRSRGKIEIKTKTPIRKKSDLSLIYTPGVGEVSSLIGRNKKESWNLTNRANQVAIVSDGSAVLGLGDLGPEAAMPVMEGKAVIFKEFAGIDAIPLCIDTRDPKEIIQFCRWIAPSFAGINLEDISAPRCFDILKVLEQELSIPVFHDDQDGTAIVVLAGLINACKLTGKSFGKIKVVINGAGAAGIAIARLLAYKGIKDLIILDSRGAIFQGRKNLNNVKKEIAKTTNKSKIKGGLKEVLIGADVFIGVSKAGLVDKEMIKSMNKNSIVFTMANPVPEIMPDLAIDAGAAIVGTGRSDFPNQINNALVFPGLFRGLLDHKIVKVSTKLKVAVAEAVAGSIKPSKNKILPSITDKKIISVISRAMKKY